MALQLKIILILNSGLSLNSNWHKQSTTTNSDLYHYDETQVGEDDVFMVGLHIRPQSTRDLKTFVFLSPFPRHLTYLSRRPSRDQTPKELAATVSYIHLRIA